MAFSKECVIAAHEFSSNHGTALLGDIVCGCFYCLRIFNPKEITQWINDSADKTAICPYCGIDSVIGSSSGFPIGQEFLTAMQKYWF